MTALHSADLKLTKRQTGILLALYRFRFLTRQHIQHILHHKNHSLITRLLKELTDTQLITKYDSHSVALPALYSLNVKSRRYLKKAGLVKQEAELKRVWWEKDYSPAFRNKCLFIADIYIDLLSRSGGALRFWTKAELRNTQNLIEPAPDAYFIFEAKRYFLDAFTVAPGKALRARVKRYADYFAGGEWQSQTHTEFPDIILLCPTPRSARLVSGYIKDLDEPDLRFLVSSDRALPLLQPKKKA